MDFIVKSNYDIDISLLKSHYPDYIQLRNFTAHRLLLPFESMMKIESTNAVNVWIQLNVKMNYIFRGIFMLCM